MQRELFEPQDLVVKPATSTGPRLWFRRLVIWGAPEAPPIRDLQFTPGLNIIWSPDPADRGPHGEEDEVLLGPGHGAGKTLLCRLLRYCLGEPYFASEALRSKIFGTFKDGRVGVELVVDGATWIVVRSIGVFPHDVVLEGGTLESAVAPELKPTGMRLLIDLLVERFLTADVAALVARTREGEDEAEFRRRAWLLAVAWLARDQECHFVRATEWRAAGSDSGSPARRLSVEDATNVVRALLGAITPREYELDAEIQRLDKQREGLTLEFERRRWLQQRSVKHLKRALKIRKEIPEGSLLGEFLRSAARDRVTEVSTAGARGELASIQDLEVAYEAAREAVTRLRGEVADAESARELSIAMAAMIQREAPGLTASVDEAELPTCPVCEVPVDRAMAEGCKLSHKLPDLVSLRQRLEENERDLRARQDERRRAEETLERLRPLLLAGEAKAKSAWLDLQRAHKLRDERTDVWYSTRRIVDDIVELEKLLAENEKAEKKLARVDEALKKKRALVGTERDRHGQVFMRLGEHFDPLVRRLLGPTSEATGRVYHDGNGLHLSVQFGGERSTPAIDLVKVLAFDLATLCRSIEGATWIPAFLIHDSPRTSDLGLSIYHELFHVMRMLEDTESGPQFQYIVTTTSRPPDVLGDKRKPLTIRGSPAAERLLGRDL